MRFSLVLLTLVFIGSATVFPQTNNDGKRDYQWISGYVFNNFSNCRVLDFNSKPMATYGHPNSINLGRTSTNICDTNGQMLFYTNGLKVCDKAGTLMPNGDSLSPGLYANAYNMGQMLGLNLLQGAIILPMPYNQSKYIVFHESRSDTTCHVTKLLYSIVDMSLNNGLGDVERKNIVLINDTIVDEGLTAVRHSNNRDWWLIVPQLNNNSYYRIWVNPEGVWLDGEQEIGKIHLNGDYSVRFSPDGTKYAYAAYCPELVSWPTLHPAELFRFDRSDGTLGDPREFSFYDSIFWIQNIAFSPNSRLLYASLDKKIYQWNTDSQSITSTSTIVGEWDGYNWGWAPVLFGPCQLAPDNKIYICSTTPYMHVIDKPDIPGVGCDVIQRYIQFPNNKPIESIPNYPDFRLGSDTHTAVANVLSVSPSLRINPNPANEIILLQLIGNSSKVGSTNIEIVDNLGRLMTTIKDIQMNESYQVSTTRYSSGLYLARILINNRLLSSYKFQVVR